MRLFNGFLFLLVVALMPINLAKAAFHLMQIEQVIAGVNGDTTAQAIQLRMRAANQGVLTNAKIEAANAAGVSHVILERMPTNVTNDAIGTRVLLATANFVNYTNIPLVADYIMDPIPLAYLAAGRLKFMQDNATAGTGTIYWSLAWGGAAYTGSHTGATDNDDGGATGNFGPAVNIALPSTNLQALRFKNAANALSTTNLADYELTTGSAVFVNNAGTSFTVVTNTPGDFNDDGKVDASDYIVWSKNRTSNFNLAGNGDEGGVSAGVVDDADYNLWKKHFGRTYAGGSGGGSPIPEPGSSILLFATVLLGMRYRRRMR